MASELEAALYHAAALTFEEMAFALPMPETPVIASSARRAGAEVAFRGPFAGRLVLAVGEDILPALAADMLGGDEPPPRGEQEDALGELTNVVCGNLLPAVAGTTAVFVLDAPNLLPPGADTARSGEQLLASVDLALADGSAALSLYGDAAAAAALGRL